MSSDIVWQVIRNNSCFLRHQKGINKLFSTEKFNLKKRNSKRYNGLVNNNAIDIAAPTEGKGIVLSTKTKKVNHPNKAVTTVTIKNQHKVMRSIANVTKDLKIDRHAKLAQRRAAVILRSQKPKPQKKNVKKAEA